jgi:hypothetical protein
MNKSDKKINEKIATKVNPPGKAKVLPFDDGSKKKVATKKA